MTFQAPYNVTDLMRVQLAEKQMQQDQQQAQQENIQAMTSQVFDALGQFAGQYADNKALEAKGSAYGDFLKRHGEQLGFDPAYLEDFLKKKPREQAMIGDSIIGMQNTGRQLMNINYLNQQMAPRASATATGAGTPAAGGGGDVLTF
jgi:hypothetical protein